MKTNIFFLLLTYLTIFLVSKSYAQIGYYDAPYTRYEADVATKSNATTTTTSFDQALLQSEASEQKCVNMSGNAASVSWTVSSAGDGLVVRYCVPIGETAVIEVFANNVSMGTMTLDTYYSWESLWNNGNGNNNGVSNQNAKMRFDERRMRMGSVLPAGGTLRLQRVSGNVYIDFAELELVPAKVTAAVGDRYYNGTGANLQAFIDANGGATIYLEAGFYDVNRDLYFGVNNTKLKGAGMWYTQLHFTSGTGNDGGLWGQAANIGYSGLYLTTSKNSRTNSYKGINGVYTGGTTISNVWVEHFECGAWIANYNRGNGPDFADNFTVTNCRFRNNYADGINLCVGTQNAIVEHCSFRNNGDDDMAIWSATFGANNRECANNTFRYNTSENTWRASGVAIYGGYNNTAHNILIQDNVEVGIKVNNAFGGYGFSGSGMHNLYNIIIKRCGTDRDLFDKEVGAIEIGSYDWGAGTRVQNVKFSCIDIFDSKNNAISLKKVTAGSDGMYNLVFENITINGTGREFPDNSGSGGNRGYMIKFSGSPGGSATYCGMSYSNRGGNAGSDLTGAYTWNAAGSCPGGCNLSTSSTTITTPTNGTTYGGCSPGPVNITATSVAPSGNTINYIEFFVDGNRIGSDNSSSYNATWNSPTDGTHSITAVSHYSPSNATSTSAATSITVGGGVRTASSTPTIDGTVDAVWNNYTALPLTQGYNSDPDLAASYKIMYNATHLFLLVEVTDDDLRNDSGNDWEDDGVEVYIDMGNNKSGAYAANDFQYGFMYGNPASSATASEYQHAAMAGVTFAQGAKAGGYLMEIRIPWATLGGAPSAGNSMGFDVKINDDDGGGTRDHQLSWTDGTFNAWNNTALFGTHQFLSCGPLPVNLINFSGELKNDIVKLSWASASEVNHEKYVIERSSNRLDWEGIGEVFGTGNANSINNYDFSDYYPLSEILYYRLKQVDTHNEFEYSKIVIIINTNNTIHIGPNPVSDNFTITTDINGEINITIEDITGKIMYQSEMNNIGTPMNVNIDFVSGVYFVTLHTDSIIHRQKIIKQ